ncbi:MAG TPA: hypothetical protein VMT52_02985 [Planctomycetota bacterium]|nr:hypothetical protein [Planctomycetota bacterium]
MKGCLEWKRGKLPRGHGTNARGRAAFRAVLAVVLCALLGGCAGRDLERRESTEAERYRPGPGIEDDDPRRSGEVVRQLRGELSTALSERETILQTLGELKTSIRGQRQALDQLAAEKSIAEEKLRRVQEKADEARRRQDRASSFLSLVAREIAVIRSEWRDLEGRARKTRLSEEDVDFVERNALLGSKIEQLHFEMLREGILLGPIARDSRPEGAAGEPPLLARDGDGRTDGSTEPRETGGAAEGSAAAGSGTGATEPGPDRVSRGPPDASRLPRDASADSEGGWFSTKYFERGTPNALKALIALLAAGATAGICILLQRLGSRLLLAHQRRKASRATQASEAAEAAEAGEDSPAEEAEAEAGDEASEEVRAEETEEVEESREASLAVEGRAEGRGMENLGSDTLVIIDGGASGEKAAPAGEAQEVDLAGARAGVGRREHFAQPFAAARRSSMPSDERAEKAEEGLAIFDEGERKIAMRKDESSRDLSGRSVPADPALPGEEDLDFGATQVIRSPSLRIENPIPESSPSEDDLASTQVLGSRPGASVRSAQLVNPSVYNSLEPTQVIANVPRHEAPADKADRIQEEDDPGATQKLDDLGANEGTTARTPESARPSVPPRPPPRPPKSSSIRQKLTTDKDLLAELEQILGHKMDESGR